LDITEKRTRCVGEVEMSPQSTKRYYAIFGVFAVAVIGAQSNIARSQTTTFDPCKYAIDTRDASSAKILCPAYKLPPEMRDKTAPGNSALDQAMQGIEQALQQKIAQDRRAMEDRRRQQEQEQREWAAHQQRVIAEQQSAAYQQQQRWIEQQRVQQEYDAANSVRRQHSTSQSYTQSENQESTGIPLNSNGERCISAHVKQQREAFGGVDNGIVYKVTFSNSCDRAIGVTWEWDGTSRGGGMTTVPAGGKVYGGEIYQSWGANGGVVATKYSIR
jgi:hypothetical protein